MPTRGVIRLTNSSGRCAPPAIADHGVSRRSIPTTGRQRQSRSPWRAGTPSRECSTRRPTACSRPKANGGSERQQPPDGDTNFAAGADDSRCRPARRGLDGNGQPRDRGLGCGAGVYLSAVLAAAQALGHRPSAVARSLKLRTTRTHGLLVTDIQKPYPPEIVRVVEDAALERNLAVVLCNRGRRSGRRGDDAKDPNRASAICVTL